MENRQYELMHTAAQQKITKADPAQLAAQTGLFWNGAAFEGKTLGIPIRISWPECKITPALELWHELTILQYIANTDGADLSGRFISMSEFSTGGLARGTSFDRENDRTIGCIGVHPVSAIQKAAEKLGGTEISDRADLAFLFCFLPKVPIKLSIWLADEEFPASGKVLFDAAADTTLKVEAAGTAAGILLSLMENSINNSLAGGAAP